MKIVSISFFLQIFFIKKCFSIDLTQENLCSFPVLQAHFCSENGKHYKLRYFLNKIYSITTEVRSQFFRNNPAEEDENKRNLLKMANLMQAVRKNL